MTVVTTGAKPAPISGDGFSRQYSVFADTRRRWSDEEKEAIVAEALRPRENVSAVARRHRIKPNILFRWREMAQMEAKPASAPAFLPVSLKATSAKNAKPVGETSTADSRIEIEFANGRRIWVGPGADLGALKRILDIVDQR